MSIYANNLKLEANNIAAIIILTQNTHMRFFQNSLVYRICHSYNWTLYYVCVIADVFPGERV